MLLLLGLLVILLIVWVRLVFYIVSKPVTEQELQRYRKEKDIV